MITIEKILKKTFSKAHFSSYFVDHRFFFQFSQLPKESQFSRFMGLNKDLENIRKQQLQRESSEIRKSSLILVFSFVLFGSAFAFFLNDDKIQFKVNLSLLNFKRKIFRNKAEQIYSVQKGLDSIYQFLQKNPYEYEISLKYLLALTKEGKVLKERNILQKLITLYSYILKKNFMAGDKSVFTLGITHLTEGCLMSHDPIKIKEQLINILLIKGSIKQMYLGLVYYQKEGPGIDSLLTNEMLLQCMEQNLKNKIKQKKEYFEMIGAEKLRDQYPQILFREKKERFWISQFQQKLHLNIES